MPKLSFAVSDTLNAEPAVCGLEALAVKLAAPAGLTVRLVVPVLEVGLSVAVSVTVSALRSVMLAAFAPVATPLAFISRSEFSGAKAISPGKELSTMAPGLKFATPPIACA